MKASKNIQPKRDMSFIEVLESEFYNLVEQLEHRCSDLDTIQIILDELYLETGFLYTYDV